MAAGRWLGGFPVIGPRKGSERDAWEEVNQNAVRTELLDSLHYIESHDINNFNINHGDLKFG